MDDSKIARASFESPEQGATPMRSRAARHLVTAVATAALLSPGTAWAQQSDTATAGMQSPSPSPSGNGGPDYCGNDPETGRPYVRGPAEVFHTNNDITAGQPFTYDLSIPGPYNRVVASIAGYSWSTPTQRSDGGRYAQTGNGDGPFGKGEVARRVATIHPTTNTKLFWHGALYCGPTSFHGDVFSANPVIVNVAPRLSLTAVRDSARVYTFSGVATTPDLAINLYRVNADGSEVLTSQTRATAQQTWTITRTFLGSGRFGFVVRTGRTMANAPGASNVRPTVIH